MTVTTGNNATSAMKTIEVPVLMDCVLPVPSQVHSLLDECRSIVALRRSVAAGAAVAASQNTSNDEIDTLSYSHAVDQSIPVSREMARLFTARASAHAQTA
jgi:hypothetical protein